MHSDIRNFRSSFVGKCIRVGVSYNVGIYSPFQWECGARGVGVRWCVSDCSQWQPRSKWWPPPSLRSGKTDADDPG